MDESIYRLIPEPYNPAQRPPKYKSKFNGMNATAPSYSTFPTKGTPADGTGAGLFKAGGAAIGRDVGQEVNPKKYLKKGSGAPKLPEVTKFERHDQHKPSVPTRNEKPVMGLVSDKNFVMSNAVEAIVTAPKRTVKEPTLAVNNPNFGKVPKYLEKKKVEREREAEAAAEHEAMYREYQEAERSQYYHQISEEEKEELVAKLKERWEEKHKMYQALPFARDTAMQIARKEAIEKEMKEIEQALDKLNKKVLYVYNDNPQISRWAKQQAMTAAQKAALKEMK